LIVALLAPRRIDAEAVEADPEAKSTAPVIADPA